MGQAVGKAGIENDREPVGSVELPVRDREALRRLHPGIERQDPEGGERGADGHESGRQRVQPAGHAVAPEQHHAQEAGFEKESGQDLVAEQRARDVSRLRHEPRPVRAELEAHGDARHHPECEGEREDFHPQAVGVVHPFLAGAHRPQTQIEQHPGKRDGDGREQDVERDVEPELGAGKQDRVSGHRQFLWAQKPCVSRSRTDTVASVLSIHGRGKLR